MILHKEIITKIKSVDKNLATVMKHNKKTDKHLLKSVLEDLSFLIGRLSGLYEALLETVPVEDKD